MMRLKLSEHKTTVLYPRSISLNTEEDYMGGYLRFSSIEPRFFKKKKGTSLSCFQLYANDRMVSLEANYYIGLDWVIPGECFVQVLPKMNFRILRAFVEQLEVEEPDLHGQKDAAVYTKLEEKKEEIRELNYLKMLLDAMAHPIVANEIDGLILIDWKAQKIEIERDEDMLTPFLVVQFLKLLKDIVKKGLRKSYFKVRQELNNRIRGKILVGEHIKRNVMKHRLTSTYCEYQEFGVDSTENRFLKKVLSFVKLYVSVNKKVFNGVDDTISQMINFCTPIFEHVTELNDEHDLRNIKTNPFFKEYKDAIRIGSYILKKFAYNITNTVSEKIETPPFWIDMPMLFELYTYGQLLKAFDADEVEYHHTTYGNELDFLINRDGAQMVVDTKYKMHYKAGHIHSDIRQVSGYARLKTVYEALKVSDRSKLIDCLIIFPSSESQHPDFDMSSLLAAKSPIKAYEKVFKLGIPMPWIQCNNVGE